VKSVITAPIPARGRRRASTPRRVCAPAAVPVLALWTLGLAGQAPLRAPVGGACRAAGTVVHALLGPTACCAAARVLRPHSGPDGERLLSSDVVATTSPAGPEGGDVIVWMPLGSVLGAAGSGVLTVVWGLAALLARAAVLIAAAATSHRRLPAGKLS